MLECFVGYKCERSEYHVQQYYDFFGDALGNWDLLSVLISLLYHRQTHSNNYPFFPE